MKIQLWPKTTAGKWASGLILIIIVLMALKLMNLAIIRLPFPTPFIAVFGVAGFVMGLISIIKNKERALLTLLSVPVGLLIIFWIGAEIVNPH